MTKRKKRTFRKRDVGKVFRWKKQNWGATFWAGNQIMSMENDTLFLCHSVTTNDDRWYIYSRAYLYKPNRKNKWLLGDLHLEQGVGYWEELSPLEVMVLFGNDLPRKYKRKQFK